MLHLGTNSYFIELILFQKEFHHDTRLYNFDPIKPNFYIVKLGFTWVYIIFLISAQKHSRICLSRNMKNIRIFI